MGVGSKSVGDGGSNVWVGVCDGDGWGVLVGGIVALGGIWVGTKVTVKVWVGVEVKVDVRVSVGVGEAGNVVSVLTGVQVMVSVGLGVQVRVIGGVLVGTGVCSGANWMAIMPAQ